MHKISDEFEFRPDRTTDYGVSCPWASKKFPTDLQWENGVSMLACSFLIESSSKLLVTRTGIKARTSSILGRIRRLILELLALEWRKFHTFELEYLWSQLANLDQILCVASLGWGKGCIRFLGRLTLTYWTQVSDRCPWATCFKTFQSLIKEHGEEISSSSRLQVNPFYCSLRSRVAAKSCGLSITYGVWIKNVKYSKIIQTDYFKPTLIYLNWYFHKE